MNTSSPDPQACIQPYPKNPFYWQYKGKPVLLLGGSIEDNLFQIADVEEHLDLLVSVGGNYVRCTMSSRDPGDAWPFARVESTGLHDLNQFNPVYWEKFARFLKLTHERDIILQIEVWDRFDFARAPWQDNPFNPQLNSNYTVEESALKEEITTHPCLGESAFFRTVPALEDNTLVRQFQEKFVDELLRHSLQYPNVLYCMDNETSESPEWGAYWARYIRQRAKEAGVPVQLTEMWDSPDLDNAEHANTIDHPEIYDFIDISQVNHQDCRGHALNLKQIRQRILDSGHVRPMNSVKIYGANDGTFGGHRDAQERIWRNIFAGLASARFHRPFYGIGLNEVAQAHIRSLRMITDRLDIFTCEPRRDLLQWCSYNEAHIIADSGRAYAIFFPDGGNPSLEDEALAGKTVRIDWLDILKGGWLLPVKKTLEKGELRLTTPHHEGYFAALVTVQD